jgi:hypothetical protein
MSCTIDEKHGVGDVVFLTKSRRKISVIAVEYVGNSRI